MVDQLPTSTGETSWEGQHPASSQGNEFEVRSTWSSPGHGNSSNGRWWCCHGSSSNGGGGGEENLMPGNRGAWKSFHLFSNRKNTCIYHGYIHISCLDQCIIYNWWIFHTPISDWSRTSFFQYPWMISDNWYLNFGVFSDKHLQTKHHPTTTGFAICLLKAPKDHIVFCRVFAIYAKLADFFPVIKRCDRHIAKLLNYSSHTVDGSEIRDSTVDMVNIPLLTRFYTSQVGFLASTVASQNRPTPQKDSITNQWFNVSKMV